MTLRRLLPIHIAAITTSLCLAAAARAQGPGLSATPVEDALARARQAAAAQQAAASRPVNAYSAPALAAKPALPISTPPSTPPSGRSMLDQPAIPAKIEIAGNELAIEATNASLSDVIRQVAARTGMRVDGNLHDERVFGNYGPGSPPEVLSALLYDSGYNVLMVGSNVEGVPRQLVLSPRTAGPATQGSTALTHHDEEDDDAAVEVAPLIQQAPIPAPPPPAVPGQPRTPQQMLEELQRMHRGEQPTDAPHNQ